MYVCVCVCIYIYMCIYVYIIYIYIYIHIYVYTTPCWHGDLAAQCRTTALHDAPQRRETSGRTQNLCQMIAWGRSTSRSLCAALQAILSNAPKGNGVGAKGSQNQTRVLRTMPSREKQGL